MKALALGIFGTFIPGELGYQLWGWHGLLVGNLAGIAFVILIGTLWFGPPGKSRR